MIVSEEGILLLLSPLLINFKILRLVGITLWGGKRQGGSHKDYLVWIIKVQMLVELKGEVRMFHRGGEEDSKCRCHWHRGQGHRQHFQKQESNRRGRIHSIILWKIQIPKIICLLSLQWCILYNLGFRNSKDLKLKHRGRTPCWM